MSPTNDKIEHNETAITGCLALCPAGYYSVPSNQFRVLSEPQLVALLTAFAGPAFEDKRDTALVRLFGDTGCRRAEMAGLREDHVHFVGD